MALHSLRAAALCGLLLAPAVTPAAWAAADPVIATVNGTEIRRSALDRLVQSQSQLKGAPVEAIYDQLLDHLVSTEVILTAARKENVQNDPAVKSQLRDLEDQLIRRTFLSKHVNAEITDAKVKAHYDELVKKIPPKEEVRVRHILVQTEDEAKAAITEIKGGAKFDDVAARKSMDGSKDRGGDLGYLTRDVLVESFAEAAFKLKPGEMTQEPVKTPFGWHVIKMEDKRVGHPAFDEVKDEVRADLADGMVQKVVEGLRAKATIKKFTLDGSPAAAPKAGADKKK
ncbi:MAG: peptidylprolyl isomerase [Alphaproteobacteria bacterium]